MNFDEEEKLFGDDCFPPEPVRMCSAVCHCCPHMKVHTLDSTESMIKQDEIRCEALETELHLDQEFFLFSNYDAENVAEHCPCFLEHVLKVQEYKKREVPTLQDLLDKALNKPG